ncbi:MAG: SRPBCC family protein [Proteobacteria bacterium]|nr:SRPBCC family protein [Pseudomonadota bacterium]
MLQKVIRSTIIDAPIARVWAVLRDFNSHDRWHDVVEQSRIERNEQSSRVGCVRNFALKDGNRIREQLLALDDVEHKSIYCIVEATVPLQRYVATVTLKPVTDGNRTFWHWESTFATPPGMERELRDMVAQGVYEAGFANLRRHLRVGGDLRRGDAGGARPSAAATAMPRAMPLPSRRAVVRHYGGPDLLQAEDGEAPAPGPGEVRIRQRAIGINFLDVYLRRGWIPPMLPLPGVPGMEAAGSVIDTGEGVTGFLPGDRVAYLHHVPGAYCSVRTVPADAVVRLPAAIEDETAAAVLLKGITADVLLHDLGHVRAGTKLLVHAAAGALGLMVASWARRLGATVIGTVSTEAKARVAREAGCDHVIVTADYRFADDVQRLGGADVVIDGLGDAARDENYAALARRGHWISVGQATGTLQPLSPDRLVAKSITFSRPAVFDYVATAAQLAERAQHVWDAIADGRLKVPPIERHALDAAADAHRRLESRGTIGALILIA